jgi:hypothetical protein
MKIKLYTVFYRQHQLASRCQHVNPIDHGQLLNIVDICFLQLSSFRRHRHRHRRRAPQVYILIVILKLKRLIIIIIISINNKQQP